MIEIKHTEPGLKESVMETENYKDNKVSLIEDILLEKIKTLKKKNKKLKKKNKVLRNEIESLRQENRRLRFKKKIEG